MDHNVKATLAAVSHAMCNLDAFSEYDIICLFIRQ